MNIKPKWVIFDVGQVLYDFQKSIENIARHLKMEKKTLDEEMDKVIEATEEGELTFEETWQAVLKEHKLEHELENIQKLYWNIELFLDDTRILLHELHNRGYKLALFTNNWPGMGQKAVDMLSIDGLIDSMFESSVEKLRKPDIKFYHLVENRTKAKAKEIFFIDDRAENLESAKKLGWQTFLYVSGDDEGKSANNKLRKILL